MLTKWKLQRHEVINTPPLVSVLGTWELCSFSTEDIEVLRNYFSGHIHNFVEVSHPFFYCIITLTLTNMK